MLREQKSERTFLQKRPINIPSGFVVRLVFVFDLVHIKPAAQGIRKRRRIHYSHRIHMLNIMVDMINLPLDNVMNNVLDINN